MLFAWVTIVTEKIDDRLNQMSCRGGIAPFRWIAPTLRTTLLESLQIEPNLGRNLGHGRLHTRAARCV